MSDDMFYARVCAERDQLRVELAAAKNLLARIHRDGGHHTEAVGFTQSVADAGDKVSEWLLVAEERTALAAHVERLEKALNRAYEGAARQLADPRHHGNDQYALTDIATTCELALAATPAQSLAAHDAALLRKLAAESAPGERADIAPWLMAEADRIEKEAGDGKA